MNVGRRMLICAGTIRILRLIAQKKKHRRNRIIKRVWLSLCLIRLRTVLGSFSVPVSRGCSACAIKSRLRYSVVYDRFTSVSRLLMDDSHQASAARHNPICFFRSFRNTGIFALFRKHRSCEEFPQHSHSIQPSVSSRYRLRLILPQIGQATS